MSGAGTNAHREGVLATRSVLTLGGTLIVTAGIGLAVRLVLVRVLGPASFGELRFAENAAEMLFVLLTLGVDTVIRREAATAPERVHRYLLGLLVLRTFAGAALLAAIATVFALQGYSAVRITLFAILGLAQILITLNNSYSALEHASGAVGWIARTSLLFKLLWAAFAVAVILFAPSVIPFAAALLMTELLRFVKLTRRTMRRAGRSRPDLRAAATAAVSSWPFFINFLAYSAYARLGTWWLGAVADPREVGWYGAAAALAAAAMLGMPVVQWVLVPSAARAVRQGEDAMARLLGGALRMALLAAVPASVFAAIWAPQLLQTLFGAAYLPAVFPLRALAMTFGLAYVATICSISLIQQDRVRTLAWVSATGLGVSLVLNAVLIPWGARTLGLGGAASGAALATLLTETAVAGVLLRLSWERTWNASVLRTVGGLALAAVVALLIARGVPIAPAWAALASTAAFFATLAATRTIAKSDFAFCRSVLSRNSYRAPIAA